MKPPRKVHKQGPVTGGGFRRTLCEKTFPDLDVTDDPHKVTCQKCLERMA